MQFVKQLAICFVVIRALCRGNVLELMLEALYDPECVLQCKNASRVFHSKGKNEFSNSGTIEQEAEAPGVNCPFVHTASPMLRSAKLKQSGSGFMYGSS
jgi:hypothetical protein